MRTLGKDFHYRGVARFARGVRNVVDCVECPSQHCKCLEYTALLYGWDFDPLGKLSISHDSRFPFPSKGSLHLVVGALIPRSLWASPRCGLPTSFLKIIADFPLPSRGTRRRGSSERNKRFLYQPDCIKLQLPLLTSWDPLRCLTPPPPLK